MASTKNVGELNGIYAKLFKLALWGFFPTIGLGITIATAMLWWMWRLEDQTQENRTEIAVEKRLNAEFRHSGERFTQSDGKDLMLRIRENQANIRTVKEDIGEIKRSIDRIEMKIDGDRSGP